MFEAILRIFVDVVSILTMQPRPRAGEEECRERI